MLNDPASVPLRLYLKVSLLSESVADIAEPTSVPPGMFSAMERVVLPPSVNVGALLGVISSLGSFVTEILTEIESVPSLPSETVTVTS